MRVTNLRLKFPMIVWKRVVVASFPPRVHQLQPNTRWVSRLTGVNPSPRNRDGGRYGPPRRAAFRGVRDGLRGTSHFHVAMALVTR